MSVGEVVMWQRCQSGSGCGSGTGAVRPEQVRDRACIPGNRAASLYTWAGRCRFTVSVRIGMSVRVVCPFARGLRGPPVFCPKASRPVVQLAHCVWTPDSPIDRGKNKLKTNETKQFIMVGLRYSSFLAIFLTFSEHLYKHPNGATVNDHV